MISLGNQINCEADTTDLYKQLRDNIAFTMQRLKRVNKMESVLHI